MVVDDVMIAKYISIHRMTTCKRMIRRGIAAVAKCDARIGGTEEPIAQIAWR